MQGDLILEDIPERTVVAVRSAILNKTVITDEDLNTIPDEYTRDLMKKWNRMFP
jgi:hypothetical protein